MLTSVNEGTSSNGDIEDITNDGTHADDESEVSDEQEQNDENAEDQVVIGQADDQTDPEQAVEPTNNQAKEEGKATASDAKILSQALENAGNTDSCKYVRTISNTGSMHHGVVFETSQG